MNHKHYAHYFSSCHQTTQLHTRIRSLILPGLSTSSQYLEQIHTGWSMEVYLVAEQVKQCSTVPRHFQYKQQLFTAVIRGCGKNLSPNL